jgi:Family of unknown function (DUF6627)
MEGFMRSSRHFKTISRILILAMLHLCWLTSYGYAEMIPTESAVQSQTDRQRLLDLLDRQDVVNELQKYGISKVEATVRINSLTDEEVTKIVGKLDELPPGGGIVKRFVSILFGLVLLPIAVLWAIVCIGLAPRSEYAPDILYYVRGDEGCFGLFGYSGRLIGGQESSSIEGSSEMGQCLSPCYSDFNNCMEDADNHEGEEQCEQKKQMCIQECEGEEDKEQMQEREMSEKVEEEFTPVTIEEDCDPGMESCT